MSTHDPVSTRDTLAARAARGRGARPSSMADHRPAIDRVPLKRWLAVLAVATATFTVVTAEQLPAGLLTLIAGGLHLPDAEVGRLRWTIGSATRSSAASCRM